MLGDATKEQLQYRTLRLWDWLDEAKKVSLRDWVRQRFWWLATIAIAAEIVLSAYLYNTAKPGADVTIVAVPAALALLLGLLNIRTVLNARNWWLGLSWAGVFFAIAILPLLLVTTMAPYFKDLPSQLASHPTSLQPWLWALLLVGGLVIGGFFAVFLLIFWTIALIGWLSIYGLTLFLYAAEFVVRRMAEHKQALIALAGISGALALLMQWLLGPKP